VFRSIPLLATVALVVACTQPAPAAAPAPAATATGSAAAAPFDSGPALAVLGTENFYADLLRQIGGPRVLPSSLLNDPNADPHEFEASPKAAAAVADAKLVIVNGLGYDDWMQKLLAASNKPDRVVINVQTLLGLKDGVNAHIWYEPGTMPKVADAAAAALAKLDPRNATYFAAQRATYVASFQPLNDRIAALKARHTGAPVAFTEPVAEYLTDAIGLKVLTPRPFMEAVEQGVDPAPADVAAERDLLTAKKVKVLLYNGQVTSPLTKDIQDLAVKNGIPVVGVAETIPPAFNTFQDWMLGQLDALANALAK
jgi:zinc/manganese transport system substrate-binding protein